MNLWVSLSFSVLLIGLILTGLAILVIYASAKLVYQAQLKAKDLEERLADCQARVDKAIALWNEEQDRLSSLRASLAALHSSSLATVQMYRQALSELVQMVSNQETRLPPRVM
jgi:biopolymer transport protein ExbB/TolQ